MKAFKKDFLKDIDLKDGKVVYYDFEINFNLPFENQKWSFKEDLIQIHFNEGKYIIDVGWYPEFNEKGSFVISVINDYDWNNPIFEKNGKSVDHLIMYINKAIKIITLLRNP